MNKSLDEIDKLLKKKVPDVAPYSKMVFAPIRESFQSKENIEAMMEDEISYLFFPFGKKFVKGDTLQITELCQNPFNPSDSIEGSTKSYLANIDEQKQLVDINSMMVLDLSEFKEMMKDMVMKMARSFGVEDSIAAQKVKELDNVSFDITNEDVITFNYKTTWPVKVVKTGRVTSSDPKEKKEKIVVKTITIK